MGAIVFQTDAGRLQARFQAALDGLRKNVTRVAGYDRPVLIEGACYQGIWLECGPLEGAIYAAVDPQPAVDNHRIFFRLQREDGYLPCWVRSRTGTGQIQMVVPIAATAWEVYERTREAAFLDEAYAACARWDAWLARFRDTRGTGLCEMFCEYDTGHDNSPRCHGLPKACPGEDARVCPPVARLPYLAPDLSATVYGGRLALARMARELSRPAEADRWLELAEKTRRAILAWLFDPEDLCFYDLDARGKFVRIRGDALTRVLSEHVADPELFEAIYRRQIRNPEAFWTPYPLPSIAANDPTFVRNPSRNSWGGASQALTALRVPRWFEHYGQFADLAALLTQWLAALVNDDGFRQQMDPWTGLFTPDKDGYSPAMLVMLECVTRLHGARWAPGRIEWNCRLPQGATFSEWTAGTPAGEVKIIHRRGVARLQLKGRDVATVTGTCRLVTDERGKMIALIGLDPAETDAVLAVPGAEPRRFRLKPDQREVL